MTAEWLRSCTGPSGWTSKSISLLWSRLLEAAVGSRSLSRRADPEDDRRLLFPLSTFFPPSPPPVFAFSPFDRFPLGSSDDSSELLSRRGLERSRVRRLPRPLLRPLSSESCSVKEAVRVASAGSAVLSSMSIGVTFFGLSSGKMTLLFRWMFFQR